MMLILLGNLIFALLILGFSLRLVSKKHHCEKLSFLLYLLLFFLCAIQWQMIVFDFAAVKLFWYSAIALGGVLMLYFNFSSKTYYYIKDLDLREVEHLVALEELVREYLWRNLSPGAVELRYRFLTFYQVDDVKQKELVGLIDEYISQNSCDSNKDWRLMIIFAVSLQIVVLVVAFLYNMRIYF